MGYYKLVCLCMGIGSLFVLYAGYIACLLKQFTVLLVQLKGMYLSVGNFLIVFSIRLFVRYLLLLLFCNNFLGNLFDYGLLFVVRQLF